MKYFTPKEKKTNKSHVVITCVLCYIHTRRIAGLSDYETFKAP